MRKFWLCLLALLCLSGCGREETAVTMPIHTVPVVTAPPETETLYTEPDIADFVRVLDYIPAARQELRYATRENFTGEVIYDFQDAYLRYGTVKKLMAVSADLEEMGMYLKIWDAFRPVSAQFTLWEVYPDAAYVANPNTGFSSHSRGNTVDVTIVDAEGNEFSMPTGFDDFSARADRNYSDCSEEERNNAVILELIMEKHGFSSYAAEWWHYSDTDSYPVEEVFRPF